MSVFLLLTVFILLPTIYATATYNLLLALRDHIPGNLIADLFHFHYYGFFDVNPAAIEAPRPQGAF